MNLTSCENCGVVYDKTRIKIDTDMYDDEGSIDRDKARWNSYTKQFELFIECPSCGFEIFYATGDLI